MGKLVCSSPPNTPGRSPSEVLVHTRLPETAGLMSPSARGPEGTLTAQTSLFLGLAK